MSDVVARLRSSVSRPSLRAVATAPVRARTYGNVAYLALAFPLGLAYFVFVVVGLSLSVGFAVLLVGLPLFVAVLLVAVALTGVERALAQALLGVDVESPSWRFLDREGAVERLKALVADRMVWLGLVFLVTKLAVGVAAFTLLVTVLVPVAVLVGTPLYYQTPGADVGLFLDGPITRELSVYVPWNELLVGVSFVVRITSIEVDTAPKALVASGVGLIALVLALNVFNGVAWLCGQWVRLLLDRGSPLASGGDETA